MTTGANACLMGGIIDNQEDSLVVNKAAIERGLFDGSKFTYYKTELEQKEELGNPDASKTDGLKSANYEKLVNGIVQKGDHIYEDDVLVGKYMPVPKSKDQKYVYLDRSVVYKESEEAIVHNVVVGRNEEDMRFCKVALRNVRPVAVGDKFCLTDDHEVLTATGWKRINAVAINELVATLNSQTGNLEWQSVVNTVVFDHDGDMYEISNGLISLKTTAEHKMYVKDSTRGVFTLKTADQVSGNKVWYKRWTLNNNKEQSEFNLPSITLPWKTGSFTWSASTFEMNDWLAFLGIYLAEGHIDQARNVRISAHKQRVKDKLNVILPNMGLDATIYPTEPDYYYIKNLQVSNYLSQFGKANDKYIPDWCKSMGKSNSKALLEGLLLGDGFYDSKANSWEYYTNSKRLADDVQILAIMTEQSATITVKSVAGESVVIKGNETKRTSNQYRVFITTYMPTMEPSSYYRTYTEGIINFNGKVYCIEVPNHVFLVRRNDKYCWTGNSSRSG